MPEIKTKIILIVWKNILKNLTFNSNQEIYLRHNCSKDPLDNLFQELYKRFIIPLFQY